MTARPVPELRVRRAGRADAAELAELGRRTFYETFAADNRPEDIAAYLSLAFGPEIQAHELEDPALTYLLIEADGETAGYALVRTGAPPACVTGPAPIYLGRFYVDRPWHGRGVAQRLMAACRTEARARGARTLWLCVWERNPRAIAFYAKCGFRDAGPQQFMLGTDAQTDRVMALDLTADTGGADR